MTRAGRLILLILGGLMYEHQIAWTTHIVGAVLMLAALGWGTTLLFPKDSPS